MGIYAIELDVFDKQIGVFDTFEAFQEYFDEMGIAVKSGFGANALSAAVPDKDGVPYFAMVLPDGLSAGTVAHESLHMVDFICDAIGIPIDLENTEIRGYMIAHIVNSVAAHNLEVKE